MKAFYAICLIGVIVILIAAAYIITDYLRIMHSQQSNILTIMRTINTSIQDVWGTVLKVRDNTSVIIDLLDKDEEESKEEPDASTDGWTISPCPVCGGPACMCYDRNSGDGYFVICDKHSKHEGCGYGIVAGGKTRKTAAFEWNKAVLAYCNKKMQLDLNDGTKEVKE